MPGVTQEVARTVFEALQQKGGQYFSGHMHIVETVDMRDQACLRLQIDGRVLAEAGGLKNGKYTRFSSEFQNIGLFLANEKIFRFADQLEGLPKASDLDVLNQPLIDREEGLVEGPTGMGLLHPGINKSEAAFISQFIRYSDDVECDQEQKLKIGLTLKALNEICIYNPDVFNNSNTPESRKMVKKVLDRLTDSFEESAKNGASAQYVLSQQAFIENLRKLSQSVRQ